MNADPINAKIRVNNRERKFCVMDLKDIFDPPNQSIDINKYEDLTCNLAATLPKPMGEEIRMSGLNMPHKNNSITPEDKSQDQ